MNYAKAVRIARTIANISQQELAERASLNRSYISLIESGDRNATTETLEKIASAIGIPNHLFTLLAVDDSESAAVGKEQIQRLGIALAELLLHSNWDDGHGRNDDTVRTHKLAKPKRPRVSAR
jgi:transcriptional regulator with XRE-family HTH domain